MKRYIKKWKNLLLFSFLCVLISLAVGCGTDSYVEIEQLPLIEESGNESESSEQQSTKETDDPLGENPGGGDESREIDEDGVYTTKEDVALYIHLYGRLPGNFMTKKEARSLGWSGGSLEEYAPGMCIGGDRFGSYEGALPEGKYHECDINTLGKNKRGPERLVFSEDGRIYYTPDHYETFTLLYE